MKPFRTILFAADFSEASHEAFSMACSLAVEGETKLHVLHVDEPNWVPEEPAAFGQPIQFYDDEIDGSHMEALSTNLSSAYTPSRPVDVAYHTRHGEAAAEILRLAEEVDADLIVSGTHGRTGLSWMLAGSVATSVLRDAHCPVLVVRSSEWLRDGKPNQFILHPTDFSENSEEALRVARVMARELGVRLVIYHVAPFDVYLSDMVVPVGPPGLSRCPRTNASSGRWAGPQVPRGDPAQPGRSRRGNHSCGGRGGLRPDRDGNTREDRASPTAHGERRRIRAPQGRLPGARREDSQDPLRNDGQAALRCLAEV